MLPFREILWVKSVSLVEGQLAYAGRDPTVRAREPRRPGDVFELHATPEDADSLGDPAVGELVVLTQHGQLTHLVRAEGAEVEPRPRRTIRKGTRDERFSVQRTFSLVCLLELERAPWVEEAFGFDPDAGGGETHRIEALPAFVASGQPLWMVQRRIANALEGPSALQLYLTRHQRQDDLPWMFPRDFSRRRDDD
jgi:hypothetical protein